MVGKFTKKYFNNLGRTQFSSVDVFEDGVRIVTYAISDDEIKAIESNGVRLERFDRHDGRLVLDFIKEKLPKEYYVNAFINAEAEAGI